MIDDSQFVSDSDVFPILAPETDEVVDYSDLPNSTTAAAYKLQPVDLGHVEIVTSSKDIDDALQKAVLYSMVPYYDRRHRTSIAVITIEIAGCRRHEFSIGKWRASILGIDMIELIDTIDCTLAFICTKQSGRWIPTYQVAVDDHPGVSEIDGERIDMIGIRPTHVSYNEEWGDWKNRTADTKKSPD